MFGLGMGHLLREEHRLLRGVAELPVDRTDSEIDNLFLTYGAELGLIGLSLWVVAFVLGVGGALVNRGPPDMRLWRIGLGAYALFFLIVANAVFPQAFPNLILWVWAGVLLAGSDSAPDGTGVSLGRS